MFDWMFLWKCKKTYTHVQKVPAYLHKFEEKQTDRLTNELTEWMISRFFSNSKADFVLDLDLLKQTRIVTFSSTQEGISLFSFKKEFCTKPWRGQ